VRELKHALERGVLLSKNGIITIENLPEEFSNIQPSTITFATNIKRCLSNNLSLQECLSSLEKTLIMNTLKETGGKKIEAAKRLGISRKVLWKKLKNYGIEPS
jgi:DNA-binding NtrC family response regulator